MFLSASVANACAYLRRSSNLVIAVLLTLGVIYPAVWSRKASRRREARDLIKVIFSEGSPRV